jgi:hypothetical protein
LDKIYDGRKMEMTRSQYDTAIQTLKHQFGEDLESFNKHKEKYCAKVVEGLIFSPILAQIENGKKGQSVISKFFSGSNSSRK